MKNDKKTKKVKKVQSLGSLVEAAIAERDAEKKLADEKEAEEILKSVVYIVVFILAAIGFVWSVFWLFGKIDCWLENRAARSAAIENAEATYQELKNFEEATLKEIGKLDRATAAKECKDAGGVQEDDTKGYNKMYNTLNFESNWRVVKSVDYIIPNCRIGKTLKGWGYHVRTYNRLLEDKDVVLLEWTRSK